MAFIKLFRVTDTNGERWHIAAPSFSRAVEAMSDWENIPHESDDEIVRSVEAVEDLIHGGNRDEDMASGHAMLGDPQKVYQPQDWTLANNMAMAISEFLKLRDLGDTANYASVSDKNTVVFNAKDFASIAKSLRDALDAYEQIPF